MKTRELTAEDIAIHTPFKVRVLDTVTNTVKVVNFAQGSSTHWVGIKTVLNYSNIYKLILRPLSQLNKTIIHNGEEFDPLIFISRYVDNGHNHDTSKVVSYTNSFSVRTGITDDVKDVRYHIRGNKLVSIETHREPVMFITGQKIIKKLIEWKYDINNLIGQGLAISTEDIKEKVYE